MTSREPFSTCWTGDRLEVTAHDFSPCVMGVSSGSRDALPRPEVTLEHDADLPVGPLHHHPSSFSILMVFDWSPMHLVVACLGRTVFVSDGDCPWTTSIFTFVGLGHEFAVCGLQTCDTVSLREQRAHAHEFLAVS